jgi:malate dehydrogenase (quinone)
MRGNQAVTEPDVAVVGAGIMSATLATMLTELQPALKVVVFESQGGAALESSDAWSNAGTGHAANCEADETPELSDGSIDISKALAVNGEFDLSRQFWSYLVRNGAIASARSFIHPVPHMSFVRGADRVAFLEKRYAALGAHTVSRGWNSPRTGASCATGFPWSWKAAIPESRSPPRAWPSARM